MLPASADLARRRLDHARHAGHRAVERARAGRSPAASSRVAQLGRRVERRRRRRRPASSTSWRARTLPRRSQIAPRRKRAPRSSPSTSAASRHRLEERGAVLGPLAVVGRLAHQARHRAATPAPPTRSAWRCRRGARSPRARSARRSRIASRTVRSFRSRRSGGVAGGIGSSGPSRRQRRSARGVEEVWRVRSALGRTRARARRGPARCAASTRATEPQPGRPAGRPCRTTYASSPSSSTASTPASEPVAGQLQRLGPHADDHARRGRRRAPRSSTERRPTREPSAPSPTGSVQRFIAGEPMKPATNVLAGRSNSSRGVRALLQPRRRAAPPRGARASSPRPGRA